MEIPFSHAGLRHTGPDDVDSMEALAVGCSCAELHFGIRFAECNWHELFGVYCSRDSFR